jgi:hypothetical protein
MLVNRLLLSTFMLFTSVILHAQFPAQLSTSFPTINTDYPDRVHVFGMLDNANKLVSLCGSQPEQSTINSYQSYGFTDLLVARFSTDGVVDTTFGTAHGYMVIDFDTDLPAGARILPGSMVQDSDAQYYVITSFTPTTGHPSRLLITKINTLGVQDETFNGSSFLLDTTHIIQPGDPEDIIYCIENALIDTTTDTIYILGSIKSANPQDNNLSTTQCFLGAYDYNIGLWDIEPTIISTENRLFHAMQAQTISGTKHLILTGTENNAGIISRYTIGINDFTLDPTFGVAGTVTVSQPHCTVWNCVVNNANHIFAVGTSVASYELLSQEVFVFKLLPNGDVEIGFGTNGFTTHSFNNYPLGYPLQLPTQYPQGTQALLTKCTIHLSTNNLYITGNSFYDAQPFVYKVASSDGSEVEYKRHYFYDVDTDNQVRLNSGLFPLFFPVQGTEWETNINAFYSSVVYNNHLYIFGTSGFARRSTVDQSFETISLSDSILSITTANDSALGGGFGGGTPTILTDTGTINVLDIYAHDSAEIIFSSFSINSGSTNFSAAAAVPAVQTFSTPGVHTLDIEASVTPDSTDTPISLSGTMTLTINNSFTLATIDTFTLLGRDSVNNINVEITVSEKNITNVSSFIVSGSHGIIAQITNSPQSSQIYNGIKGLLAQNVR